MGNHIEITTEDLDWITWCVAQQVRVSSHPLIDKEIETLHNKLYSFQFRNPPEAKTYSLSKTTDEIYSLIQELVQTNGVAHCYDRYCNDDEWTYCIFCEEGDRDPHKKSEWQHKPDCLMVRARALLDSLHLPE